MQLEANNEQLECMARDLEIEKAKTDNLLSEMLPASVAHQLKSGLSVDAREYEVATVMFSDVPSFQQIVPLCQPKDVVYLLNNLFTRFDRLVVLQNAYKVETVGDSYMSVAGVPDAAEDHCEIICHLALGMLMEARNVLDPISGNPLNIRAGIHSGPVVAGVVGAKMPRSALQTGRFEFESRGKIQIKGKGEMSTFFLLKSHKRSIWEVTQTKRGVTKPYHIYKQFPLISISDENINSIDGYQELRDGITEECIIRKPNRFTHACTVS
ncbi:unnamed protein product [Heligmosomoides polygyrus]|uniref:guanylate cyclase n=1 Tax=Heligmosomoides polygyrus TaxID=6339 RepID=A0A3P8EW15_HELPZ|nr:unnamed protein product [Heligmosomoides polygyrus]